MNDDELGQHLHDELHARVRPPAYAPEQLHEHMRNLGSMDSIREPLSGQKGHTLRNLFAFAAAIAVVTLIGSGLLTWQGTPPGSGVQLTPTPAVAVPVFGGPAITSVGRVDANVAWVVSSSTDASNGTVESLRITQDGGSTWSEPRPLPEFSDIQFVDAVHGWLIDLTPGGTGQDGQIGVERTEDGGLTWTKSSIDIGGGISYTTSSMSSTTLHFRDELNGVALEAFVPTGSDGMALPSPSGVVCVQASTSDGGATWSAAEAGPCLMGPTFVDPELGYASGTSTSTLYVTSDGGQTWARGSLPLLPGASMDSSVYVNLIERRADGTLRAVAVWASGSNMATVSMVSSDGGLTWSISGDMSAAVNGYEFVALGEGHWLALSNDWNFPSTSGVASGLVTEDAGVTWQAIALSGLPSMFTTLDFVSATDGWAAAGKPACESQVSSSGTGENAGNACNIGPESVFATTDGGATWKAILAP